MTPASTPDPSRPSGPLFGTRVVELAHWMAGPLAAGVLADWGAEVVKIEPAGGDPMRSLFASLGTRSDAPNAAFIAANRGKRSVRLEIKDPEHRQALERLLGEADVFVTNLRPDALSRLGLGPAETMARFPRLVYCSVSAYGLSGPDRDRPGYELAAYYARCGISHEITTEGTPPAPLMQGIGDNFTALSAAAGVLAALLDRGRTGRGRVVEASILRTGMWALAGELGSQAMGGRPRPPPPREDCRTPLYNSYRTADGRWFFLVCLEAKRHLPNVLAAIGRGDLSADERFSSARSLAANRREVIAILDEAFGAKSLAGWAEAFDAHDVWWAPVQTPAEVVTDRQAEAAGAWVGVETGDGGTARSVEAPVRFGDWDRDRVPAAPGCGEHTEAVLAELGYGDAEIERLSRPPA